jgi:hypothetical protein
MIDKSDRKTERQKDRKTERQKDRKTERQKDRKTERQKDRKTERQKDRKTDSFCKSVDSNCESQIRTSKVQFKSKPNLT